MDEGVSVMNRFTNATATRRFTAYTENEGCLLGQTGLILVVGVSGGHLSSRLQDC